jgi:hypothetical protein
MLSSENCADKVRAGKFILVVLCTSNGEISLIRRNGHEERLQLLQKIPGNGKKTGSSIVFIENSY